MKNSIKSLMLLTALGIISQNALAKKTSGELFNSLAKVANTQNTSSALTKQIKNASQNNSELFYGIANSYKDAISRGALGKAATSYVESYVQNITSDIQNSIEDIVKAYESLLQAPFDNARKTIENKLSEHVTRLTSNIGDNFVNNENLKKLAQIEDAIVENTNAKNALENNTNIFDTINALKTRINTKHPNLKDANNNCFTEKTLLSVMSTEIDKSANKQLATIQQQPSIKIEEIVKEPVENRKHVDVQQETGVVEQIINNEIEKPVKQITVESTDEQQANSDKQLIVYAPQQPIEEVEEEKTINPHTADQHFLISKMQQDRKQEKAATKIQAAFREFKTRQQLTPKKQKKSFISLVKSIYSFLSMNNDAAKEMILDECPLIDENDYDHDNTEIENQPEQNEKNNTPSFVETLNYFASQLGQGDLYEEDATEKQLEDKQQTIAVILPELTEIPTEKNIVFENEVPAKKASLIKSIFSFLSMNNDAAKSITLEMCDLDDNDDDTSIEKTEEEQPNEIEEQQYFRNKEEKMQFYRALRIEQTYKKQQERNQELRSRKIKAFAKKLLKAGCSAAIVAPIVYLAYTSQTPNEAINPILEIAKEATTCGLGEAPKSLASRAAECYTSCGVNKICVGQCLEQLYKFVMWKNEHGV